MKKEEILKGLEEKEIKTKEEMVWNNRMEYLTSQGLIREDMVIFEDEIPLVKEIIGALEKNNTPIMRIDDILTLVKYHSMFSKTESYQKYK